MYSSAVIWGMIVDARGPRILLACACVLLFSGYSGIRHFYSSGAPSPEALPWVYHALIFCNFLTGFGGDAGLVGSINATAKTFPDFAVRASFFK